MATGFFGCGAGLLTTFFFAAGFAFFGAGLRSGFLGLENLTGFFFDLVAIDRLVGKGARGLESDDFAPARMESVRPANLTDLLHNVNNLGLQTGHFGGGQAGLAEAGGEGVAAGL